MGSLAGGQDFQIEGLVDFKPVGSGGFSTVYAAWDTQFNRWVAVKVLHGLDGAGQHRFERELRLNGQLADHPHVITPFRSGETSTGARYVVMEYLQAGSLQDMLDRFGPIDWRRAIGYVIPIADALGYGHSKQILHRDIKPANILLTANDSTKLVDFGIASAREATATQVAFTMAHAPPETFLSQRDERSDLYSLASTLYALVLGRSPFQIDGPDNQAAHMRRIIELPVPYPNIDPQLDQFLLSALDKNPANRPYNAADFTDRLAWLTRSQPLSNQPPGNHFDPNAPQNSTPPQPFPQGQTNPPSTAPPSTAPPQWPLNPVHGGATPPLQSGGSSQDFPLTSTPSTPPAQSYVPSAPVSPPVHSSGSSGSPAPYAASPPASDLSGSSNSSAPYSAAPAPAGPPQWPPPSPSDPSSSPLPVATPKADHNYFLPLLAVVAVVGIIGAIVLVMTNDDSSDPVATGPGAETTTATSNDDDDDPDVSSAADDKPTTVGVDQLLNTAQAHLDAGEYLDAVDAYTDVIAADPDNDVAFNNRGLAYANLGQYEQAISDYDEAIALDPDYGPTYTSRGLANADLGQYQQAIDDYDTALKFEPDDGQALSARGIANANLDRNLEAIDDYTAAIAIDPKNDVALNNRGLAYANLGRYEEAIDDYTAAIELDPGYGPTYTSRGFAYTGLDRHDEAIDDYTAAIAIDPDDASAFLGRSLSYEALGQQDLADVDLATVDSLDGG